MNKFEKKNMVIELHKKGKTLKEISIDVHMSFRDISKIIKEYENKIELEERKKDSSKNNNGDKKQVKRISKGSRAYELFLKGRNPVEVAIELDMCFEETRKYWTEYLRLNNMKRLYNIFNENEFHLDYLFKIDSFLLRNEIPIKNIENVLRVAHDITNLYQTHSNLKAEKEKLEQEIKKNNFRILPPLHPLPKYPASWNSYYYY